MGGMGVFVVSSSEIQTLLLENPESLSPPGRGLGLAQVTQHLHHPNREFTTRQIHSIRNSCTDKGNPHIRLTNL